MRKDEISITCYVYYLGMDIVDNFCDKNDATMIPMSWMRTHCCKTLLTFLFKLTSSCFSSLFVLPEPQQISTHLWQKVYLQQKEPDPTSN